MVTYFGVHLNTVYVNRSAQLRPECTLHAEFPVATGISVFTCVLMNPCGCRAVMGVCSECVTHVVVGVVRTMWQGLFQCDDECGFRLGRVAGDG